VRGLNADERATLERWKARVYVIRIEAHPDEPPPEETHRSLFARRLAAWEPTEWGQRAVPTALGEVALRVDAAARAAGVWT
jgi:hypothetical protein